MILFDRSWFSQDIKLITRLFYKQVYGSIKMPGSSITRLEFLVLVDDYSGHTELLSEHGFSTLINVYYERGSVYSILFDTGMSGRVLLENADRLGVDLSRVDIIVFSHRHYDHTGGLESISSRVKKRNIVAHPDILKPCYSLSKGFYRFNIGLKPATRNILRDYELILVRKALELAPNAWFLGEVERYYDNSYAVRGFKTLVEGELVDDQMLDDTGLAFKIGDTAVVIAGCSHSGISNIVRKARKLTGADRIVAIGGFHLISARGEEIEEVVKQLESEGVVEVHTGHCTGLRGEAKLLDRFKDKTYKIHSGYTYSFAIE